VDGCELLELVVLVTKLLVFHIEAEAKLGSALGKGLDFVCQLHPQCLVGCLLVSEPRISFIDELIFVPNFVLQLADQLFKLAASVGHVLLLKACLLHLLLKVLLH